MKLKQALLEAMHSPGTDDDLDGLMRTIEVVCIHGIEVIGLTKFRGIINTRLLVHDWKINLRNNCILRRMGDSVATHIIVIASQHNKASWNMPRCVFRGRNISRTKDRFRRLQ